MSDLKVNAVEDTCPSFYKEKVKVTQKNSKLAAVLKKVLRRLKGEK